MMLNDPCDHRYVLYALGEGLGNLWEASGLPPQPPGVIAGGVRLVSFSAVLTHLSQDLISNKKRQNFVNLQNINMMAEYVN